MAEKRNLFIDGSNENIALETDYKEAFSSCW